MDLRSVGLDEFVRFAGAAARLLSCQERALPAAGRSLERKVLGLSPGAAGFRLDPVAVGLPYGAWLLDGRLFSQLPAPRLAGVYSRLSLLSQRVSLCAVDGLRAPVVFGAVRVA